MPYKKCYGLLENDLVVGKYFASCPRNGALKIAKRLLRNKEKVRITICQHDRPFPKLYRYDVTKLNNGRILREFNDKVFVTHSYEISKIKTDKKCMLVI